MKQITILFTITFIALLSSPSWSKNRSLDDLIFRDGLHYEKFSTAPYTGQVKGLTNGWFVNGKKNGQWTYWYEEGQLERRGMYENGKETGEWTFWYENGQLYMIGSYQSGKSIGSWTIYWENGRVFSQIEHIWNNQKWISRFEKFRDDGSKLDKGETISYTGNILNQVRNGMWTSFHENNQKKSYGRYILGEREGLWLFYFDNGNLLRRGNYKNGKYEGIWESYTEENQLEYSVTYKDGELVDED